MDCLSCTVLVCVALRIALKDVIAGATDTATRQTLEIIVANIIFSLIPMKTCSGVHARVRTAAKGRFNAVIIGTTKSFRRR